MTNGTRMGGHKGRPYVKLTHYAKRSSALRAGRTG